MASYAQSRRERAVSPVIGIVVVVALTVVLSVGVLTAVPMDPAEPQPTAHLTLSADASTDRITLRHRHGTSLDVTALNLTVRVNGEPLSKQPPVPFFASDGFVSGPTGPFNTASPNVWRAGETASFQIATTNTPQLTTGATLSVRVTTDRTVLYKGTVTVR